MTEKAREKVGDDVCLLCGMPIELRRNVRGHIYYMCSWSKDGCGCNFQSRTDDCDSLFLKRLGKKKAANLEHKKDVEAIKYVETKAEVKSKPMTVFDFLNSSKS